MRRWKNAIKSIQSPCLFRRSGNTGGADFIGDGEVVINYIKLWMAKELSEAILFLGVMVALVVIWIVIRLYITKKARGR